METDEEGKACASFKGGPPVGMVRGAAWAPFYIATSFHGIIPDVIKLTPLGE